MYKLMINKAANETKQMYNQITIDYMISINKAI